MSRWKGMGSNTPKGNCQWLSSFLFFLKLHFQKFPKSEIDLSIVKQTLATVAHVSVDESKICSADTSKTTTRIKSSKGRMSFISRKYAILTKQRCFFDSSKDPFFPVCAYKPSSYFLAPQLKVYLSVELCVPGGTDTRQAWSLPGRRLVGEADLQVGQSYHRNRGMCWGCEQLLTPAGQARWPLKQEQPCGP